MSITKFESGHLQLLCISNEKVRELDSVWVESAMYHFSITRCHARLRPADVLYSDTSAHRVPAPCVWPNIIKCCSGIRFCCLLRNAEIVEIVRRQCATHLRVSVCRAAARRTHSTPQVSALSLPFCSLFLIDGPSSSGARIERYRCSFALLSARC